MSPFDLDHPDYKAWLSEQARLTEAVIVAAKAHAGFHNEGYMKWRRRLHRHSKTAKPLKDRKHPNQPS